MSIARKRLMVYLVMIFSLIIGINLARDIFRLNRSDERLAASRNELEAVKQERRELERKIAETEKEFWLESRIRNVLKMARPGEVVVIIPETAVRASPGERLVIETEEIKTSNFVKWLAVFGFRPAGV